MTRFALTTLVTLLVTLGAFALDEPPAAIQPEEALQRAAQLRLEASAHQQMEHQLAAQTGGSRRDRRWRKTMIELCHEYTTAATRAAEAYERAAAPESASPAKPQPHTTLPVTAAEYDARASEYEEQAESLRADADRHMSMLRSSRNDSLEQQPYYDSSRGAGQRRSSGWFEAPKERTAREHCEEVVQQNLDLARDADNIAKHFRLRARQLEAAR